MNNEEVIKAILPDETVITIGRRHGKSVAEARCGCGVTLIPCEPVRVGLDFAWVHPGGGCPERRRKP